MFIYYTGRRVLSSRGSYGQLRLWTKQRVPCRECEPTYVRQSSQASKFTVCSYPLDSQCYWKVTERSSSCCIIVISDMSELHAILKPFILRRVKSDVLEDLPQRSEVILYHGLSTLQKKLYKAILTKDISKWNYYELVQIVIMITLYIKIITHLHKVGAAPLEFERSTIRTVSITYWGSPHLKITTRLRKEDNKVVRMDSRCHLWNMKFACWLLNNYVKFRYKTNHVYNKNSNHHMDVKWICSWINNEFC